MTIPSEYINYLNINAVDSLIIKLYEDGIKIQSDKLVLQLIKDNLQKQLGNVDLAQEIINNQRNEVKNAK